MKKQSLQSVLSFVLLAVLVSPITIFAQSSSSTDGGESFGRSSSEWRQGNSQMQEDIDDLDEEVEENLTIPVLFGVAPRNLTKNYGDPRSNHAHIGLDIMAAEGTPIVSPTEAVVTGFGVWTGAGNYVQTRAPGGETFVYMHLSEIADIEQGDVLKVGDVIGYVGHTGNAAATAPHLHFEIHDKNNETSDPYPRFTKVFDLKDKMKYLEEILDNDADDEDALAELLLSKFRSEFVTAQTQGIYLPKEIKKALGVTTVSTPTVVPTTTINPSGLLKVGSRGTEVVVLQTFLIKKNIGSGGKITADGAFGPMTRKAVIEYQASVGLVADGVAGAKTLSYIKNNS